VVPELPGITVGGAIAGGGLESSSHQHGQVSDTVLEIECLTPELRVCSPDHDSDLFYAISASYNTVALMTRVRLKVAPAPQYLSLKAVRYSTFGDAIEAIQADAVSDTIEGIAYSSSEIIVIRGKHCSSPTSTIRRFSRHWDRWYHKSIRITSEMTIPYLDYCFRYNYGSFWMADYVLEMLGGDNLFTRFLIGSFLDTKHLFAVLHSANLMDLGRMRVIQDCYIPAARTLEFLNAIDEEIGVYPLWLCPISGTTTAQVLASHHTDSGGDFINVGIYGRPRQFPYDPKRVHSRLIEHLLRLEGRPMLYAQTWHTPGQFEAMYGDASRQVEAVKARHGEKGCLFGLYEKVVLSDVERAELGKSMIGTEAEETRKVVRCILGKKLGLL
jgi:FAD/FMN-containing dehydrogenase